MDTVKKLLEIGAKSALGVGIGVGVGVAAWMCGVVYAADSITNKMDKEQAESIRNSADNLNESINDLADYC